MQAAAGRRPRGVGHGGPVTEAPPPREAQDAWQRVRARLRAELGDAAFTSWLAPLVLIGVEDGAVRLGAPTKFLGDWVASRYAHRIAALWALEGSGVRSTHITTAAGPDAASGQAQGEAPPERPASGPGEDELAELGSPLNGRFTFREFIVGKPNEFAHAAARRVAEAERLPFNPLYLHGGVGLGKTHLMHAIAWCIRSGIRRERSSTFPPSGSCTTSCGRSGTRTRWRSRSSSAPSTS